MNLLFLAPIVICLLLGAAAIGIGHKRWSWGTVVAAWLVLLSAAVFFYLASRIGERERVWRKRVSAQQAAIVDAREGRGGEKPLASLVQERALWRRAFEQARGWRNRHWTASSFRPPRDDAPGVLTLDFDNDSVTKPPINAGAEVAVFDTPDVEKGGRFLGMFRVQEATTNKEQQKHSLTLVPANAPNEADRGRWGKDYGEVFVYEGLPVDRWMAFRRTQEAGGDLEEVDADVAELLKGTGMLDEVERQKATGDVPEEDWLKLAEAWDRWKQAAAGTDEAAAAKQEVERVMPTGRYWADVEFTEPHTFAQNAADPREFAAGEAGSFDLETALELRKEKKIDIKRVFYRRRLTDAYTALRGGEVGIPKKEQGVMADGMHAIGGGLAREIADAVTQIQKLKDAVKNTRGQIEALGRIEGELKRDLEGFRLDATAAEQTTLTFEKRCRESAALLEAEVQAVVASGESLRAAVGRLSAEIDRRAPGP